MNFFDFSTECDRWVSYFLDKCTVPSLSKSTIKVWGSPKVNKMVIYLGPVWIPAFFCQVFLGFGFSKFGFQQSRLPQVLA